VPDAEKQFEQLLEAMKCAAGVLLDADVPFLVGGGLAAWARSGPKTGHDVDFLVRPADAERARQALADAGYCTEQPSEQWLYKAWVDDVLVDLIFDPSDGTIGDGHFERADELEVQAVRLNVASLEDVMTSKLLALTEQEPDFSGVLELGRSLREQIDWDAVRKRTANSPFATAFFTLAEELNVVAEPRPK
jgi:Uncharacterised nucleotidyltransferase